MGRHLLCDSGSQLIKEFQYQYFQADWCSISESGNSKRTGSLPRGLHQVRVSWLLPDDTISAPSPPAAIHPSNAVTNISNSMTCRLIQPGIAVSRIGTFFQRAAWSFISSISQCPAQVNTESLFLTAESDEADQYNDIGSARLFGQHSLCRLWRYRLRGINTAESDRSRQRSRSLCLSCQTPDAFRTRTQ